MIKVKVLKNIISVTTYEEVISRIFSSNDIFLVSPIASQTIARAYFNRKLEHVLDKFDYLLPDSQWLRWSILFLYGERLKKRIYGPELMLRICKRSEREKYKIFLYGNTQNTLNKLNNELIYLYPNITITNSLPSKFKKLTLKEKEELVDKIIRSHAKILFIGLGSPYQEIFSEEISGIFIKKRKKIVIIPVGAAFDFISRVKPQAPQWMQNSGLEWLFRLLTEPKRLWKRYLFYGPLFILLIIKQKITQFCSPGNHQILN